MFQGEFSPQPFTIRGHHLSTYAWVIRSAKPLEYAENHYKTFTKARARAAEIGSIRNLVYINDVIGTTAEQGATWRKNITATMTRFLMYSEHHPVELVTGRPDEICRTTTIGKHCLLSHALLMGQESYLQRDGKQITAFQTACEQMGYDDSLETFTTQTQFVDGEPIATPALRTTLGVIRTVLANPEYSWANTGPGNP